MSNIEKFETWLKDNEWQVERHLPRLNCIDIDVLKRYSSIPDSFLEFLKYFKSITSQDETTWFICGDDYKDDTDDAFKWNEFELMSLGAADDDDWKEEIREWWSNKLPFLMSVKDGYSFYAIDLSDGSIVKGEEPEFEEVCIIAKNFEDFIDMIMDNAIL